MEVFRGLCAGAVHVHEETGVLGEEGLLRLRLATVGAVSVCVEQLANREAVGRLLG